MRAVVYARVSTEEQASNYSISLQIEAAKNLAAARGFEIVGEYVDEGWSGTVINRPALNRLIRDCDNGKVDVIIVHRIDRFFRDVRHLLDTMDFLEARGVKFISATEPFDTSTPVGRYILGQFGLIAELERNTFLERSRGGRLKRVAGGKWWGPPPFGYDYDPLSGTLVVNASEAAVVKLAFKLYQKPGETLDGVASELNARGYRTKKGRKWTAPTVRSLLTRELYAGQSSFHSSGVTVPVTAPQLISKEELERVRSLLNERRLIRDPKKRIRAFLLRSLVRCGECGSQMGPGYADRIGNGYRYYYYTCYASRSHRAFHSGACLQECQMAWVRAENLEKVVWSAVVELITEPEKVRLVLDKMAIEPAGEEEASVGDVPEKLKKLAEQRKVLLRSFRDGLLPENELRIALQEIADEEKFLQRRMESASGARKDFERQIQIFEAFHRSYCDTIRSLTDDERREIVLALVRKVEVFIDGRVRIQFNPADENAFPVVLETQVSAPDRRVGRKKRGRRRNKEYVYVLFPKDTWERIRAAAVREGKSVSSFISSAVKDWLAAGKKIPGMAAYARQRLQAQDSRRTTVILDKDTLRLLKEKSRETGINMSGMVRAAVGERLARQREGPACE